MIKKFTVAIVMSAALVGIGAGGHTGAVKADGTSTGSSAPTVATLDSLWWP